MSRPRVNGREVTVAEAGALVVFTGSTVDAATVWSILPDAHVCPPARCGDLLMLEKLRPLVTVVIIDGRFETSGAVWHKEILHLLERGCEVYGAASMGALRAAELHSHGMIGMGAIFEAFRDGCLVDDDEVAVLHADSRSGFRAMSDALVNIRATLSAAVTQGVLSDVDSGLVLERARRLFYADRRLETALDALSDRSAVDQWLQDGAFVDLKRNDAIALLRHLASKRGRGGEAVAPAREAAVPAGETGAFRNLRAYIACRPVLLEVDWLPAHHRRARDYRLMGPDYLVVRDLALARGYLDAAGLPARAPTDVTVTQLVRRFGEGPEGARLRLLRELAGAFESLLAGLVARVGEVVVTDEALLRLAGEEARERGLESRAALQSWRQTVGLSHPRDYVTHLRFVADYRRLMTPTSASIVSYLEIDADRDWFLETVTSTGELERLDRWLTTNPKGLAARLAAQWSATPQADLFARRCDLAGMDEVETRLQTWAGASG